MSMYGPWDLEERVEDAIVSFLKGLFTDIAMVEAAKTITDASYPLVLVEAQDSDNHNETGRFSGRRVIEIDVIIITEALNFLGSTGSPASLRKAREHHRVIKNSIIFALAGNTVHTEVNALDPEGVKFSQFAMGRQSRDAGDGKLVTIQTMITIAQPKEL